jgi:septum formation protein
MRLILASSSPYRRELLRRLALPFEAIAPDLDESPLPGESPGALALRLARQKAEHVQKRHPDALVIGSDQVADFQGTAIGKPHGFEAAQAQLRSFSDQTVLFHTALCVAHGERRLVEQVSTECRFLPLTDAQIHHYLQAEQPYDVAGSAKIERMGVALLERVRSDDPTALIGLPLIALCRLLRQCGVDPLQPRPPS